MAGRRKLILQLGEKLQSRRVHGVRPPPKPAIARTAAEPSYRPETAPFQSGSPPSNGRWSVVNIRRGRASGSSAHPTRGYDISVSRLAFNFGVRVKVHEQSVKISVTHLFHRTIAELDL